jgi:hypothetical protein
MGQLLTEAQQNKHEFSDWEAPDDAYQQRAVWYLMSYRLDHPKAKVPRDKCLKS